MTTFLKFPDEQAFRAACAELGATVSPEMRVGDCLLSVVGLISDGVAEEGEEQIYIDGFHVNALGTLPDKWDAMVVTVKSPVRVFG